ncbi:response regulator [Aeromonas veronii]|uniref:hypothetical protein n=1 Tax=Aeromonas veronii TaxID=654 RepID=UPI0038B4B6DD
MDSTLAWLALNKEWVFSGIGIPLIAISWKLLTKKDHTSSENTSRESETNTNTNTNTNTIVIKNGMNNSAPSTSNENQKEIIKSKANILFIDDDIKFKVIKILKNAGWINTKILKDLNAIDQQDVKDADIIFVDIQGVGKSLDFRDEGLGLTIALKSKFPEKAVIIYSAEQNGDRFHDAIRVADSLLAKNSEPYEFEVLIEKYIRKSNESK